MYAGIALLLGFVVAASAQISGRVVAAGMPPPQPALVNVRCEGNGQWSGYTDKRGEFIASLSGPSNEGAAAVTAGGSFSGGCRIEVSLLGFRRAVVDALSSDASGVVITLQPLSSGGDSSVSAKELAVPPAVRKWFEKAMREAVGRKWSAAEADLRKAVAAWPSYALAWNELGVLLQQAKPDEARSAFAKAIAADDRLFTAYARLAVLDAARQRWSDVAATTDRAIKLDPVDWPSLFFYNAVAHYNLGHLPQAGQAAARAIALDPAGRLPRAHYILGRILYARGDFGGAVAEMSKYLELLPSAADAARVRAEIEEARSHGKVP